MNYLKNLLLVSFTIALVIIINSCQLCKSKSKDLDVMGDWAFIDSESTYSEAYINKEKIVFFSDAHGHFSQRYNIKDDSIYYGGVSYKVEFRNCNSNMIFIHETDSISMLRVDLSKIIVDTSYFNPFHLRRCNFLVQEGIITIEQAINYLNSMEIESSSTSIEHIH